jgi:hypothetical protein
MRAMLELAGLGHLVPDNGGDPERVPLGKGPGPLRPRLHTEFGRSGSGTLGMPAGPLGIVLAASLGERGGQLTVRLDGEGGGAHGAARVGRGRELRFGASVVVMAEAYPNSQFTGFDYHEPSIATARQRASEAGVDQRVRFDRPAAMKPQVIGPHH